MQNANNVVKRMTADARFFKTDFNCSSGMLPSFNFRYVCLPKLPSVLCRVPKANLYLRKLKYSAIHFVSSIAQKRNPLNFFNFSSVKTNLPNTFPKISEWSGDRKWDFL